MIVQLNRDGELVPVGETSSAELPIENVEKTKREQFNSEPIKIWSRPFPDEAGYDAALLYIDPTFGNEWGYTLLLFYTWRESKTHRIYRTGFTDRDAAISAGLERYYEQVQEVVELTNRPHKTNVFKLATFWALFSFMFNGTGAFMVYFLGGINGLWSAAIWSVLLVTINVLAIIIAINIEKGESNFR